MRLEGFLHKWSSTRIAEKSLCQQEGETRVLRGASIIARTPATGNGYTNCRGVIHHARFEAQ